MRRTKLLSHSRKNLTWRGYFFIGLLTGCAGFTVYLASCSRSSPQPSGPNATISAEKRSEILAAVQKFPPPDLEKPDHTVRFATFNISFHRHAAGELAKELADGNSEQAAKIAAIIQQVRPEVILLNEFDYDPEHQGVEGFLKNYLNRSQHGQEPIEYSYRFISSVNTGVDSGMDLNSDGTLKTPEDAFGFGAYPGQYGMVVLSQFPIDMERVRTFQKFLWKDINDPTWPIDPQTGNSYYSEEVKQILRLSSKSHWDVPIRIGNDLVHFLASHPTPPVFDGPEDRNGCRNHDEIRFWRDYIAGDSYFYDDAGTQGGLARDSKFVIAGDLNADPADGDSRGNPVALLVTHELINSAITPFAQGGAYHALASNEANDTHRGNAAYDTAQFNGSVGNLRVDYCLPSRNLAIRQTGIFWPLPEEEGGDWVLASDHRLIWIDLEVGEAAEFDTSAK